MSSIRIPVFFILLSLLNGQRLLGQADNSYYFSPYSTFGLGDKVETISLRARSMGKIGMAYSSLVNINPDNPASYSGIRYTTFEINGYGRNSTFQTEQERISRSAISFDGIQFAFPGSKYFTLTLGVNPYTKSGYKVRQIDNFYEGGDTMEVVTTRSGDGGTTKAFLGIGTSFFKHKLAIGLNANLLFGSVSKYKETVFTENNFIQTMVKNQTYYSGLGVDVGLMYSDSLNNYAFRVGAVYGTSYKLRAEQYQVFYDVFFQQTNTGLFASYTPFDTSGKQISRYSVPYHVGFGVGIDKTNALTAAIEARYEDWSHLPNVADLATYKNGFSVRAGVELTPNFKEDNYWKKVAYRFGVHYDALPYIVKGNNLSQWGITAGLGLPFRRTVSRINIMAEYGQRGTVKPGLVRESFWGLGVGITFNDTWFIKRRLE